MGYEEKLHDEHEDLAHMVNNEKKYLEMDPVNQILFNQFNLLVTTFTVVGYGANMPNPEEDSDILILFILFGVLLFSSFAGQLQMLFQGY